MNAITLYRLLATPVLLFLILNRHTGIFAWLLGFSFFTDVLDGFLARRYCVASVGGALLDSIADDLTVVVGVFGLFYIRPQFFNEQSTFIIPLVVLYLVQVAMALTRYSRVSTFHTYLAKMATLFQGSFLILFFFTLSPLMPLFYTAVLITALQLLEEILLVWLLPRSKTDVKGLYWVLKKDGTTPEKQEGFITRNEAH